MGEGRGGGLSASELSTSTPGLTLPYKGGEWKGLLALRDSNDKLIPQFMGAVADAEDSNGNPLVYVGSGEVDNSADSFYNVSMWVPACCQRCLEWRDPFQDRHRPVRPDGCIRFGIHFPNRLRAA